MPVAVAAGVGAPRNLSVDRGEVTVTKVTTTSPTMWHFGPWMHLRRARIIAEKGALCTSFHFIFWHKDFNAMPIWSLDCGKLHTLEFTERKRLICNNSMASLRAIVTVNRFQHCMCVCVWKCHGDSGVINQHHYSHVRCLLSLHLSNFL